MAPREKKQEPSPPIEHVPEEQALEESPPASAKNIPRPAGKLPTASQKKVARLTVELIGGAGSLPTLDEIDNRQQVKDSEEHFPLLTVIAAILRKNDGRMVIGELAPEITKHWNRSLPGSPYSLEEFVYMVTRNADNLRVS